MKHFIDETKVLAELPMDVVLYARAYMLQDAWRWIPAGLLAVIVDAASAFNELFWIILILWFSDLVLGFLRAWHDAKRDVEWTKVFRSVVKLFVITVAVIAMNAIEQLIGQMGVNTGGTIVVATMLVIGSADTISILSNLSYFWPGMGQLADTVKGHLGDQPPSRRAGRVWTDEEREAARDADREEE